MEDKTFEFMEKMYSEMTKGFEKVNVRLDVLESGQKKIEASLEHDIKSNLQILHEAVKGNTVKLDEHTQQLADMNNKLDYFALSVNS